jgi:hypothetical protein
MWPVTPKWKLEVKKRLKEQGRNTVDLAAEIGATPSSLSILFNAKTKQSRLVPAIHAALGMGVPEPISVDQAKLTLDTLWPTLTDDQRQLLLAVASGLDKKT